VKTGLRTSQVAAAAGVNTQTLRYYERRGLLAEPDRSSGGHRLYPPEAVTVLRVIKAAQRLGFSLDEVADLFEAGRHRHRTERGLQARARACADSPCCPLPFTALADLTVRRAPDPEGPSDRLRSAARKADRVGPASAGAISDVFGLLGVGGILLLRHRRAQRAGGGGCGGNCAC
jgi:DNA-binding transcriptional MerR regulator